ncbi:bifunctional proline dehydrogenase/L-glutamate gamma-semialdehyde dehydrogenase PutA [Saccharospirillum sp. HFRX-1]|uniref:bifunctional proline dehydrogenase/L-glutamate gamma-semialdehyde dehydrogenase PutA n=1 Tax=unclassified Saccharospirillum TaxID=2633430 RepID=UPI0037236565
MTQFDPARALSGEYRSADEDQWFRYICDQYAVDEDEYMAQMVELAEPSDGSRANVESTARRIVEQVRDQGDVAHAVDKLLQQYSLDNEEGVILMCLAEALMRVPDADTADDLIRDKLSVADWKEHMGKSDSLLVNASTWGLMLTGKVTSLDSRETSPANLLSKLINRAGEPVIRAAMNQAMRIMGKQFVLGRSIGEAIKNGRDYRKKGYTYSFDMLGEAAFTDHDAERYFQSYLEAVRTLGERKDEWGELPRPTISIKLSALHPRYEEAHQDDVMTELADRVSQLVKEARALGVGITIDAEEMDRLELSLRLFKQVFNSADARGWGHFGLVIQAYSKRALAVLGYLTKLAQEQGDIIPIRLVKGAYWDTEVKHAQQLGLADYPVYTRKENTDVSYLVCARFLMSDAVGGALYPQFATHNAHTVASIAELARLNPQREFEFQRLHGMGDALYDSLLESDKPTVRIYAPVGAHKDLLPYLVRRLLENGANSSFVHRLVDAETPIGDLVQSPVEVALRHPVFRNPKIPRPSEMFGESRRNSQGYNLAVAFEREPLLEDIASFDQTQWNLKPLVAGKAVATGETQTIVSPYDTRQSVGQLDWTTAELASEALASAHQAWSSWNRTPAVKRAACLDKLADLMEANTAELMALCAREAGKTLQDSIDEVREAVDFCRYYANEARANMSEPTLLPGPTGESNEHYYEGRGVFLCISPWNFPLAIFTGQICAALVAGNTVLAKPAEQTSLIAGRTIELFHQAGVPTDVLHYLPGAGATLGDALLPDERLVGVAFTGSTETAHRINRTLAQRDGAIPTLIAETGGQNAMIVDSTALPEQVVADVMQSAFASAGQRCSALRVLCVQEDIADRIIELIGGALGRLKIGNPQFYATDSGPVIDAKAHQALSEYVENWRAKDRVVAQAELGEGTEHGHFLAPVALTIEGFHEIGREQFGPILHIHRFKGRELDQVIEDINNTGYGLTLGIHSRNEATAAYIEARARVGNCYVNRNQIGAVVGVQPFGGRGLSGTGPKAGGPNYIKRFATERVRTINTTAVGGNATLLSLETDD